MSIESDYLNENAAHLLYGQTDSPILTIDPEEILEGVEPNDVEAHKRQYTANLVNELLGHEVVIAALPTSKLDATIKPIQKRMVTILPAILGVHNPYSRLGSPSIRHPKLGLPMDYKGSTNVTKGRVEKADNDIMVINPNLLVRSLIERHYVKLFIGKLVIIDMTKKEASTGKTDEILG